MVRKPLIFFLLLFFYSNSRANTNYFIVTKDGSGDFVNIQDALNAIPENNSETFFIYIKKGIYKEKIFIEKSSVALIGEDRDSTKIIYAELRSNWRASNPDDYGSAVINVMQNVTDLFLSNLTVHNNYGSLFGNNDHQFAIRGGGNKVIILNCNIIADGGDTLSLWNDTTGMYYHKGCFFEGYVDFVCPRGWCLIEDSQFYGHNKTAAIWHDGSKNKEMKFVIKNSYFDGVPGFPLGRFHRDAQFFLLNCRFSKNMADKKIFHSIKNPPINLQWGTERIYYYNCHGDSIDYSWHSDNLDFFDIKISPEEINENFVFQDKWKPSEEIERIIGSFQKNKINN